MHPRQPRRGSIVILLTVVVLVTAACEEPDPELVPDPLLQSQLGLTSEDRVHTVRISTGIQELADPASLVVLTGDYVQFVSVDRMVHELAFRLDSLAAPARAFMTRTDQAASPPLVALDARFVVSFEGAPAGRYPYELLGNRGPGEGVVVVEVPPP